MRFPTILAALPVVLSLSSCDVQRRSRSTSVTTSTVEDARIVLPAVQGRPGAAYFEVTIKERDDELLSVTSQAARVELHETRTSGGVSRMGPAGDLSMKKGEPLQFSPGGKHAMLTRIDPSLKPGDTVPLTLNFRHSAPVIVEAEVRAPGDVDGAH